MNKLSIIGLLCISLFGQTQVMENWRIEEVGFSFSCKMQAHQDGVVLLKNIISSDATSEQGIKFISKDGAINHEILLSKDNLGYTTWQGIHFKKMNNDSLIVIANCDDGGPEPDSCYFGFTKISLNDGLIDFTKLNYPSIHGFNFKIISVEIDLENNVWIVFDRAFTDFTTIQKFNSNGDLLWENNYTHSVLGESDYITKFVKLDDNNNAYLAIEEGQSNNWKSYIFKKIDSDGNEIWTNDLTNTIPDTTLYNINHIIQDIHINDNGDLVFVGKRYPQSPFGTPVIENGFFVGQISKNSGLLKRFSFYEIGNQDFEWIYQSKSMTNNQILLFGEHRDYQNEEEIDSVFIAVLDTSGIVWQKSKPNIFYENTAFNFNCDQSHFCLDRFVTLDKNDNTYTVTEDQSVLTFEKISPKGEILWTFEINSFEDDIINLEMLVDDFGKIYYLGVENLFFDGVPEVVLIQLEQDPETGLPNLVNNDFSLKASPNPFTHQLNLQTTAQIKNLHIYNTTGQLVHSETSVSGSGLSMTTAQWQTGVYFVVVELEDGQVFREKVVKF